MGSGTSSPGYLRGHKRTVLFSIGYITAECRGYFGLSVPRGTWDCCVCSAVQKLGFCASLGSNKCLRGRFLPDGIPWEIVPVCAVICLKSAILRMCKENEVDMSWNQMIRPITLLVALIGKCLLVHVVMSPTTRLISCLFRYLYPNKYIVLCIFC